MERCERVRLTNPDKVLYPAAGTTKAEIFEYYVAIADAMVPHIAGRPVTRKRWPNGVGEMEFFEKQLASSAPDWLARGTVHHRSGSTTYPIIDTREGLAWIAQQASLEVHVPQWRFDGPEPGPATRIVFDLDPGEGVSFRQLCEVAHEVRSYVTDLGLTTFPLTSGSKGLHLYVPLEEPISSRGASLLAKRIAVQLEKTMPKQVTATMTKSLREGKVFLDWSQNSSAKTTIAPYSMRGREHPPWPRRARGMRSRTPICATFASTRCWNVSSGTATSSQHSTRVRRCRTNSPPTAACGTPRRHRSPCPEGRRQSAMTIRSSSRSTMPGGCTTTFASSATACWCRGRYRRTCPRPPRSTTSRSTPRTTRWSTPPSRVTSRRGSTAAARSLSGTAAPMRRRSSATTHPTARRKVAR